MKSRHSVTTTIALLAVLVGNARVPARAQELLDGRTIDQWVEAWSTATDLHTQKRATAMLSRTGESAVPALQQVLVRRGPDLAHAFEAVAGMGPPARPLLPAVIEILRDRDLRISPGTAPGSRVLTRAELVAELRYGPWMADVLVPVLGEIVLDPTEDSELLRQSLRVLGVFDGGLAPLLELARDESRRTDDRAAAIRATKERHGAEKRSLLGEIAKDSKRNDRLRLAAMDALSTEGEAAISLLEGLEGLNPEAESARHDSLAVLYEQVHGLPRADYFSQLLRKEPLVDLSNRLSHTRRSEGQHRVLDPDLVRFLWKELEQALLEDAAGEPPYSPLPIEAAYFVQDVLHSTSVHYRKGIGGTQRVGFGGPVALPGVGYGTIARVLETAYGRMDPATRTAQDLALGLARTQLLRGDWAAMNHWLAAAGHSPIAEERRSRLTAPPGEWKKGSDPWQDCAEELRSGSASITVPVTREGRPVRGAHVMVKSVPPGPRFKTTTGVSVDYLGHEDRVLPSSFRGSTFGYYAQNIDRTRYVVTDDAGLARFEGLPGGHYEVEVLLPVADSPSAVTEGWDLWLGNPGGSWSIPESTMDALVLGEGQDFVHPTLDARPKFRLSLEPWQEVPLSGFELSWPEIEGTVRRVLHLGFALTRRDGLNAAPWIDEEEFDVDSDHVSIGGPEGPTRPLAPGNVYKIEVRVYDADGDVLARSNTVSFFTAWNHRPTQRPWIFRRNPDDISDLGPPVAESNSNSDPNRPRLDVYLLGAENDFEVPYARVVRAWYDWRDGKQDEARSALEEVARTLPEGNVARETAVWLRRAMDEGTVPTGGLWFRSRSE